MEVHDMACWWNTSRWALAALLLGALVACGGPGAPGGGGPDTLFDGREHYGGPLPDDAIVVSLDEFRQLAARDDVVWDSLARQERADREAAEQAAADRAAVAELVSREPGLARVLDLPDPNDPDFTVLPSGEILATVRNADGGAFEVRLQSQRDTFRDLLAARERFPTKQNQLELYQTAYASLPEGVRASLPSPTELAAGGAEDAMAAVARLSAAAAGLVTAPTLAAFARPAGYPASPVDELGGIATGSGRDWVTCWAGYSPTGLFENFSWPLKYFQTSVKDQGNRGSCTAFALAAAVESITAMTQGAWVNVSEQHLYFQSRGVWQYDETSTKDGFMYHNVPPGGAGYKFRAEEQWRYNRSPLRILGVSSFERSCQGYDPICSDTVHQGATICVPDGSEHYCLLVAGSGPSTSGFSFSGIPFPDISTVLWEETHGTDIPLDLVRYYLQTGHPILTSLRADASFKSPFNGFVGTNATAGGGHVVLMVGFITDEAIRAHPALSQAAWLMTRADNSGGGFFVVKNSWGCSGDGGYFYIPVAWAEQNFERLRLPQRGPAPAFDAFTASIPPVLEITEPANGSSYGVSPFLEVRLEAYTDPFDCCTITWTSDLDGPLGNGREIDADFGGAEPGPRTITATATRGDGMTVSRSITIHLTTSPPNVSIVFPPGGQLFRGLTYTFLAEEFSGPNAPQPCSSYSWASSVAGEGPWSGCTPGVTFATTGPRTIAVSVTNPQGQTGTDAVDLDVVEPLADGPPVVSITSPTVLQAFTQAQRAYVAFSVVDPSPLPPISVEWTIGYGQGGDRLPITLITDPRPRPGSPSNQYFRPSDYVTPICFHSTNPSFEPYVLRVTYNNADGKAATARAPIFLNADVGICIN